MSKRELAFVAANVELEPRSKRRKATEEEDVAMGDDTTPTKLSSSGASGVVSAATMEEVKEQGNALWLAVKDAVNKEGQILSYEFMRLPSKRQYPDYYQLIKKPSSLDEIKKGLDLGTYQSLEAVKDDLELCFSNAKKYNQKDSTIWLDAKALHKVAKKEYRRLSGSKEEDVAEEGGDVDVTGDGEKKAKIPNTTRQLKGRLQKLIEKTDDEGRVISALFMDLPSKKDYPTYYTTILKPIAFDSIFKHLKRKEYHTSAAFAADVELVFANAFQFNQEESQVYQDAVSLKSYFRQLMSDLPTAMALPEYSKPNKIKLKFNGNQAGASTSSPATGSTAAPSSSTLHVPGAHETVQTAAANAPKVAQRSPVPAAAPPPPTPAPAPVPTPTVAPTSYMNQLPVAPMTAQPHQPHTYSMQPIQTTPRQPAPPYQQYAAQPQHYPNAAYQPLQLVNQTPLPPPPSAQMPLGTLPALQTPSFTQSPSPSNQRPLKGLLLTTKPKGRPLRLDHADGVKTWAMRLGQGESNISLGDVRFLGGAEEDHGSDEEVEEEDEDDEGSPRNEKGKAKRGRGRPKKVVPKPKVMRTVKARKATPLRDNVKVMLNGNVVQEKEDNGNWEMELRLGSNVLEVGEDGGMIWKVYMERVATF